MSQKYSTKILRAQGYTEIFFLQGIFNKYWNVFEFVKMIESIKISSLKISL